MMLKIISIRTTISSSSQLKFVLNQLTKIEQILVDKNEGQS